MHDQIYKVSFSSLIIKKFSSSRGISPHSPTYYLYYVKYLKKECRWPHVSNFLDKMPHPSAYEKDII
jgi:hypothetical protein